MAMDVEECIRAYPFDGVVLLSGCDKTTPAMLMGAASADVPAILLTGGPMLRGMYGTEELGSGTDVWRYWDELRAGRIGEDAIETALFVAGQAALAIDNARLYQQQKDFADMMQRSLLPQELPEVPGLEVGAVYESSARVDVGGDVYDFLTLPDGRLAAVLGDVTGHGLESGVLMVMTQAIVRALLTNGETDPVRFLDTLNRTLYGNVQRMGTDKNLTLALLDYAAGDVRLSGQHEKMLVLRCDGTVEVVDTMDLGFPVALTDEIAEFIQHTTVRLQPGDGVVLYTDGITEAENLAREQYGLARLYTVVSRHWTAPAEVIKECVVKDVHQHMGVQRMYDDITLVVVKRR